MEKEEIVSNDTKLCLLTPFWTRFVEKRICLKNFKAASSPPLPSYSPDRTFFLLFAFWALFCLGFLPYELMRPQTKE
jgi:hypothetical protein